MLFIQRGVRDGKQGGIAAKRVDPFSNGDKHVLLHVDPRYTLVFNDT